VVPPWFNDGRLTGGDFHRCTLATLQQGRSL
jgi:hypothetical protein